MSDLEVVRHLEAMEALLEERPFPLEPETLAAWREGFDAALATAERGPGWEAIVQRARSVGARLNQAMAELLPLRDALKRELDLQAQGQRALRGYKPESR